MNKLKTFLFYFCIFLTTPILAQGNYLIDNVTLLPGQSITRGYSFGPFSVMLCYSNGSADKGKIPPFQGLITFPLNGNSYRLPMPIEFTTIAANVIDPIRQIDPNGTVTIFNDQRVDIIVSCIFAY